jgi:hypothetical protein
MKKQISLLEAMRELETEAAAPKARPAFANGELTSLPLRQISKRTAVFQPRSLLGNLSADEEFVRGLVKVLRTNKGEPLDAITVWYGGRRFYVIDGHHRLDAYKRHHGNAHVMIPCVEFKGTFIEAMELAGRANHKNKLAMTQDDRLNFAWRLVCIGERTAKRVQEASGVSERIVWTMRKKLKELLEQNKDPHQLGGEKWRHIRDGQQFEGDMDDYETQEAHRMAKLLQRNFGGLHRKAHIFARAITILDDKLPERMIKSEAWQDHLEELKEYVEDEIREEQQDDGEHEHIGEEEPREDAVEL